MSVFRFCIGFNMESDTAFNLNVGPDPYPSFVVELEVKFIILNFFFFSLKRRIVYFGKRFFNRKSWMQLEETEKNFIFINFVVTLSGSRRSESMRTRKTGKTNQIRHEQGKYKSCHHLLFVCFWVDREMDAGGGQVGRQRPQVQVVHTPHSLHLNRMRYTRQCCGSRTFWYGSGSADPCL
jgi:hypothetical protein